MWWIGLAAALLVDLRVSSEFQRVDVHGSIALPDRGAAPRELLSPAAARNSFLTLHAAVTGAPGAIYWLATQSNPPGRLRVNVYRLTARDGIYDVLGPPARSASQIFAVLPPGGVDAWLIDVWVPADLPAETMRFEVLTRTATWRIAPMELRIQEAVVPAIGVAHAPFDLPPVRAPADASAWAALASARRVAPPPANVRAIIYRNALQDAALSPGLDLLWPALIERGLYWSPYGADAYARLRPPLWLRRRAAK